MSDELDLTPQQIAALRTRQIAFLAERLVDERARGDWMRSFAAGYEHVCSLPLSAVFDPKRFVASLHAALQQDVVRGHVAPIAREVNRRVVAALKTEDAKLGSFVPAEARTSIDEILARPDLIPEEVIRNILEDDVVEEIMGEVIYDALKEFNESVNPFFADWGLPALIKKVMPIGSGTVLKSMTAVRGEFDKRLEPEMRKFLLVAARKSKSKIANFVVGKSGDPKMVSLRQSVVRFFYETSIANLMKNVDDDARMAADDAILAVSLKVLSQDEPRAKLLAELEKFMGEHGSESVGEWLKRIGVVSPPALEPLAELTWPLVKLALESPPAKAFYERIVWDFFSSLSG